MTGLHASATGTSAAPAAMIRTIDGRITFWSRGMEERYGYSADEAFGQVSRELLQTRSWQELDEIEATLIARHAWRGGLIHYRADGEPVLAANLWHLHEEVADRRALVTELHADIVPPGTEAGNELADVLAALTQEVSQPLAAIGGYIGGAQRALSAPSPDIARLELGVAAAVAQLTTAAEILNRFRRLGENLRGASAMRAVHARTAAAMSRSESVIRAAAGARVNAERAVAELQMSGQSGQTMRENVASLQRLLDQTRGVDERIEQCIRQLLDEATAKLAGLDQQ